MATKDSSITTLDSAPVSVEPAAPVNVIKSFKGAAALSGKMVELTIGQGEGDIGKQPVFINLNDDNILVPRGVKCLVPVEFAEIIQNAVMVVSESLGILKSDRDVQRFSFNTRAV